MIDAHHHVWDLAVRDLLRTDAEAARNYAAAKWHAVSNGAEMLLAYSEAKRAIIEMIVAEARVLLAPDTRAAPREEVK